jgi:hypothetical protein
MKARACNQGPYLYARAGMCPLEPSVNGRQAGRGANDMWMPQRNTPYYTAPVEGLWGGGGPALWHHFFHQYLVVATHMT